MFSYVYVIMPVKEPKLFVVRVGHHVPFARFCLSLYGMNVLNRDVNMIYTNNLQSHVSYFVPSVVFYAHHT